MPTTGGGEWVVVGKYGGGVAWKYVFPRKYRPVTRKSQSFMKLFSHALVMIFTSHQKFDVPHRVWYVTF
jgi:hypothetical protein